jgi:DNA-binding response OmpR family regulator
MQGKKIIMAEASSTIKSVADSLLRQQGYDVVCTSDGLQAWEVIQAERPDLALIGLNLSGISGLELCRQVAGDRASGNVQTLLMIGAKDNVTDDQLESSGARGHLKKPFSPKDLLDAVTGVIGPADQPSPAAADARSGVTGSAYDAREFSTSSQPREDSEEVRGLNWTDLKDTDDDSGKESGASGDREADTDDQRLVIEDDQFGLATLHLEDEESPQEESAQSKDEDYDWFIGEMKRAVDGGKAEKDKDKPAGDEPSFPAERQSEKELRFDDLGGDSGELVAKEIGKSDIPGSGPLKKGRKSKKRLDLSEEQINSIAEKVAHQLAASIASKIDRQSIIKAIKSTMGD